MLLFSTILEINKSLTKEKFIKLVIEWNQGSPYPENIIPGLSWHGERNCRYGDDHLWMDIEEYRNQNIIAVRYEKKDADGIIWDTDYVMNFDTMKMAIRLDRSFTETALSMDPKFSTPHFITLLVERGYIKDDGSLPVLRTPIEIDETNLTILEDVINGKTRYRLPVVYISKTYYDEDPLNVMRLAGSLKGVAHVLVQSSKSLNGRIKEACSDQNEYYGAVGIYYPSQAYAHRRYLYHSSFGTDTHLFEKVLRSVITYSNAQMVDTLYTWQGVNNALLRDRLSSQREERLAAEHAKKTAEGEVLKLLDSLDEEQKRIRKQALEDAQAEANSILDGFDEDMERLQKQIDELTRENERLQYENQGLKSKIDSADQVPVLYMGNEDDLYTGEIKDLILSSLTDVLSNTPEKSRRSDVLRDILATNDYQQLSKKKTEDLKLLLRDYNGMTGKVRQALTDMGFVITEDGKHYKLTYYGDARYHTVFAKTPSDGRSGKNNAAAVIKSMF